MASNQTGDGRGITRRATLASLAGAGSVAIAGCSGGGGGGDTQLLKAEGSSTVYPIANNAARVWNSNPPATDTEYWPTEEYGYDTDMNLADFFASKYGFEPTGERASPPFRSSVGLSHSGTGIKSVMDGLVDIGNASASVASELSDASEETLDTFEDHVVARDGQPIVVSTEIRDAGVTKLTAEQVRGIYEGEITNWSQIDSYEGEDKEIYAVGRAEGSGTDTAFRKNMLGSPEAEMPGIDTRKGQNQQAKSVLENSDNAIAYIALAFVGDQTPAVALEFEGTTYEIGGDPGLGAADYPLNRALHMYTWDGTSKMESAFINFILSDMGQERFVAASNYFKLPESERQAQREKLADQA